MLAKHRSSVRLGQADDKAAAMTRPWFDRTAISAARSKPSSPDDDEHLEAEPSAGRRSARLFERRVKFGVKSGAE